MFQMSSAAGAVWRYVGGIGVYQDMPAYLAKHIRLCNQFNGLIILIAATYIGIFHAFGQAQLGNITIPVALSFLPVFWLNHKRWYTASRMGFIVLINVLVFFYCICLGSDSDMHFIFLALACCPWLLFNPVEKLAIAVGIWLSLGLFYGFIGMDNPGLVEIDDKTAHILALSFYAVSFLVSMLSIGLLAAQSGRIETKLIRSNQQLVELFLKVKKTNNKLVNQQKLKELNKELQKALEQKAEINKQLERFSYMLAHDLKSPLIGVRGLHELINDALANKDIESAEEYLNLVKESILNLTLMIDSILEYSKRNYSKQNIEEVDTRLLVEELTESMGLSMQVRVHISEDLPVLLTNRFKLWQVMQNLVSNAIKYNDKEEKQVWIECRDEGMKYRFTVRDNGPGIKKSDYTRLFGLFETAASATNAKQTGIGMNIIKVLVEEQGGSIKIDSEPGVGTSFSFYWMKKEIDIPALLGQHRLN